MIAVEGDADLIEAAEALAIGDRYVFPIGRDEYAAITTKSQQGWE